MKNYFTILLVSLLLLAGCIRDKDSDKSPEELAFEKAKSLITQMGYDTSDMYEGSYGYVVEGDILITQEYLDDFVSKPQTRHTFNKDGLAVGEYEQAIILSAADFFGSYIEAIDYWNKNSECNIMLSQSSGNSRIFITFDALDAQYSNTLCLLHRQSKMDGLVK